MNGAQTTMAELTDQVDRANEAIDLLHRADMGNEPIDPTEAEHLEHYLAMAYLARDLEHCSGCGKQFLRAEPFALQVVGVIEPETVSTGVFIAKLCGDCDGPESVIDRLAAEAQSDMRAHAAHRLN
jgi:hypothetical protein